MDVLEYSSYDFNLSDTINVSTADIPEWNAMGLDFFYGLAAIYLMICVIGLAGNILVVRKKFTIYNIQG